MKRIHWTLPAQADFARIDDRFALLNPTYADRVGDLAIDSAEILLTWPGIGSDLPDGTKTWPVADTPYRLVYRCVPHGIEVLRARDARENYGEEF